MKATIQMIRRIAAGCVMSAALAMLVGPLAGCSMDEGGSTADGSSGSGLSLAGVGEAVGGIFGGSQGAAIGKGVGGVAQETTKEAKANQDLYFVGRAASAQILSQYPPYEDARANAYINAIGAALAQNSTMPEVYSGYHFQIVETQEANAFAAPGAFIFITRGMLRLASTEDELAAILAHEIAHIENEDAKDAIRQAGLTGSLVSGAVGVGKAYADVPVPAQIEDAIFKQAESITTMLLKNGYSRSQEREADVKGVATMRRTGYNPRAMASILKKFEAVESGGGLTSTHPGAKERVKAVENLVKSDPALSANAARQARFDANLAAARATGS